MSIRQMTKSCLSMFSGTTFLFALLLASASIAEPLSLNPDDPKAALIEWKAEANLGDYVGRAEGIVDQSGMRFFLSGLNVMSPLVIQVFAKDENRPIDVSLHRYLWKKSELDGQTDTEGNWNFAGRVHDEVGIELKSAEPSEFYILAWKGDAVTTEFGANAFIPVDNVERRNEASGAGIPTWMIVVIVMLLLVVAFLIGKLRNGKTAAVILFAIGAGMSAQDVQAEAIESRLAAAEARLSEITELRRLISEVEGKDRASTERLDGRINALQDRADASTHNSARIRQLQTLFNQLSNDRIETNSIIATELNAIRGDIDLLFMLVAEDRAAIPDPGHGGVSPMPSACVGNPACRACSNAVNARLSQRLANYEVMRVIYQNNKSYTSLMIDVGNSMSGWHQLEQAAWFQAKVKIVNAEKNLAVAYKSKFEEFNADLRNILQDFGHCEEQYGMDDWFNRYGLLYFNNLVASYRIP